MKKIEAVVRVEKADEVTEALETHGCPGIMVTRVDGHGRQGGISEQFRGREFKVNFIPKIKIEVVVKDSDVGKIMQIIAGAAKTGDIGDGKIFVSTIDDAMRIRTGEKGEGAI